ncbi:MAG: YqjF family protein [Haloglomus sp.]
MPPLLTVTGRDVLFAHWPLDPEVVAPRVPDPLSVATFDGRARVSLLALENVGVAPGSGTVPPGLRRPFSQLNLRTYVEYGDTTGVYFLSLDSGSRLGAAVGRRAFGLPFRPAEGRVARMGDTVRFSSRCRGGNGPDAVFQARYRPDGPSHTPSPGSLEAFCIDRVRYLFPAGEAAGTLPGIAADDVVVGRIEREDWELRPVDATLRTNTLFAATGLPTPDADPELRYSTGFEMGVLPPETAD